MNLSRCSMPFGRFTIVLLLLLLGAFLLRLAAATVWQSRAPENTQLVWGDSGTYWEIAETWIETGTYQFGEPPQRMFRAPGYPAVLIAGMQIAHSFGIEFTVFHARLIGCVLGTLAVWLLVAWTTDLTGDRRIGLVAGAIMALEPGAIAMSVFVLAEAAFIPLMILSLWAWTIAWRQASIVRLVSLALLTGLITGAAILVRPSWLLFAPVTVLLALVVFPQKLKQVTIALAVGIGIVISMLPWWYRNYQLTDRWVITTLQVGASLYDGWNPSADGGSDMTHGYQATRPLLQRYRARLEERLGDIDPEVLDQMTVALETESNDHLMTEALNWGQQNPGKLLQLAGLKIWKTWRPWPAAAEVQSRWITVLTTLAFVPLFGLGVLGAWRLARQNYAWAICVWPTIYVTLLHAVFVGSIRYRQPAMIPLIVLAAVMIGRWLWSNRKRDS
ncbi:MAG: glycosyltransferase family 39 protein [Pirellulaceae bacterium]|nr:glycosyltransferase family 39 protein [Pirellulaceae bacterium]